MPASTVSTCTKSARILLGLADEHFGAVGPIRRDAGSVPALVPGRPAHRSRGRGGDRACRGGGKHQESFRLMRAALDETSKELGRYVRLTSRNHR
jgi:hypothetical protein